jgi:hypothetical protein
MAATAHRYFAGLSRNTFLLALSSLFARRGENKNAAEQVSAAFFWPLRFWR